MRLILILSLVACTADKAADGSADGAGGSDWTPDDAWGESEVASPSLEASSFRGPLGLVAVDGTLYFSDERGVHWNGDEDWWNIAPDVEGAGQLALARGGLLVADETAGTVGWLDLGSHEMTPLASGLVAPISLAGDEDTAWWIDGDGETGSLYSWSGEAPARVIEGLDEPQQMTAHEGGVVVVEAGTKQVLQVWPSGELEVVGSTSLPGRGIAADEDGIVVTTESTRWPYPGWVEDIDEGATLCESPPNPGLVLLTPTHAIFASKQTISMVSREGGAPTSLALRTDVGAMTMAGDRLIWTDVDTGRVLSLTP